MMLVMAAVAAGVVVNVRAENALTADEQAAC